MALKELSPWHVALGKRLRAMRLQRQLTLMEVAGGGWRRTRPGTGIRHGGTDVRINKKDGGKDSR